MVEINKPDSPQIEAFDCKLDLRLDLFIFNKQLKSNLMFIVFN